MVLFFCLFLFTNLSYLCMRDLIILFWYSHAIQLFLFKYVTNISHLCMQGLIIRFWYSDTIHRLILFKYKTFHFDDVVLNPGRPFSVTNQWRRCFVFAWSVVTVKFCSVFGFNNKRIIQTGFSFFFLLSCIARTKKQKTNLKREWLLAF